jgi:hypothetical protein
MGRRYHRVDAQPRERQERNIVTDERADQNIEIDEAVDPTASEDRPQYGVGPFSVREVALVAVWLIAFVASFFPVATQPALGQLLLSGSVWTNGLDWILTIGAPTVAVFLVVLRRFSPDGIRRVGSLGIDQFASVTFSVSTVIWLTMLWRNVAVAIESGFWIHSWVVWVEFFVMLAGVVLTVAAPFIPPFSEDFADRREIPAHRNARPIRPVTARPPRPKRPEQDGATAETAALGTGAYAQSVYAEPTYGEPAATPAPAEQDPWSPAQARDTYEPVEVGDTAETRTRPAQQPFWALAPVERDVVDERGVPIFRVGPTAWALVLEDRGEVFVVRHEDGTVGYLHDVTDVTRG